MKKSYGTLAAAIGGDGRDESTPLLQNRRREAAWALTVSLVLAAAVGASMLTLAYVLTTNAKSVEDHVKAQLGGWTSFGKSAAATTTATAAAAAGRAGRRERALDRVAATGRAGRANARGAI